MLFTNAGTDMNLHLSFCQWPKDNSKVLVFGYLKSDLEVRESSMTYPVPCYITVTAVPSLKGCQDCIKVAAVSILDVISRIFFKNFLVWKYFSFFFQKFSELWRRRTSRCLEFLCQIILPGTWFYNSFIIWNFKETTSLSCGLSHDVSMFAV